MACPLHRFSSGLSVTWLSHAFLAFNLLCLLLLFAADLRGGSVMNDPGSALLISLLEIDKAVPGMAQENISVLKQGEPLSREMSGGEVHAFRILMAQGQFLHLVVEQQGINVSLAIVDPDGKRVAEMESPNNTLGPERVSLVAETSGAYRLEVRSEEKWAVAGRYLATIKELRGANEADRMRVAAETGFMRAEYLRDLTPDDLQKLKLSPTKSREEAVKNYEESLKHWQALGDRHGEAMTLYRIATIYIPNNLKEAVSYFEQGLKLRAQLDEQDWRLTAGMLNDEGYAYVLQNDLQKALDLYAQAQQLFQAKHDRRGQASAYNNIGHGLATMGKMREALENYEKSLSLRRAEHDQNAAANILNNIGGIYDSQGEPHRALDYYGQALQVWRDLDNSGRRAAVLNNIGVVNNKMGEWQKALDGYEEALALYGYKKTDSHDGSKEGAALIGQFDYRGVASTLDNMGVLYFSLGNYGMALEKYEEALPLLMDQPGLKANVLIHTGQVYFLQGRLAQALKMYQTALDLKQNPRQKASTLTAIGAVSALQGNTQKALSYYADALPIQRKVLDRRGEALTLEKMGQAYALAGEQQKALESFNQALPLWRAVEDLPGVATTLGDIALIERDRGNMAEALKLSEEAINIIEQTRTKVTSQQLRTSYFATKQNYYELYIDIKMLLYERDRSDAHLIAALQLNERARARSLMEILTEAEADVPQDVSSDLIRRKSAVEQKLNAKAQAQMKLLNERHTDEQARELAKDIDALIAEYGDLQSQIRAAAPRYAALTRPLDLKEIQNGLLDDNTLLLEYALGDERSYVWAVSKTSIKGYALPKRDVIEDAAREFYKLLTAPQQLDDEDIQHRRARLLQAASQYPKQAILLSQMILGPLANVLGNRRLLIVGDGALQYLPFAALPVPSAPGSRGKTARAGRAAADLTNTVPLVVDHEIVGLPSASVLAVLRSQVERRKPASYAVAVLADPVFDRNDSRLGLVKRGTRLAANGNSDSEVSLPNLRGVVALRGGSFRPLPLTQEEALAIKEAAHPGEVMIATGFEANRDIVMGSKLKQYQIVHFATHGVLNSEHPELSGLVLSLLDKQGRAQDGILRLHDIYNLRLPADLVVLSACDTGLGQIVRGEGLVGLTRGFMYAGVPRVVASLWKVDDLATTELMKYFYRYMFKDAMPPSTALRWAQVEMFKERRWHDPFNWAAFVIQGDWKKVH
jgi:CHAT domain-containing protein/tetratricopeptide (TPR) repeat protein